MHELIELDRSAKQDEQTLGERVSHTVLAQPEAPNTMTHRKGGNKPNFVATLSACGLSGDQLRTLFYLHSS